MKIALVLLLTLLAGKGERDVRPSEAEVSITSTAIREVDWITDFECQNLGPFKPDSWTRNGVTVYPEAIGSELEIVDPNEGLMGTRALARVESCLSDEPPVIRLRVSVPVQNWQITVGPGESRSLMCWVGTDVDAPLDQPADVVAYPEAYGREPHESWNIGIQLTCPGIGCGIIACDVRGDSVDNIGVLRLGIATGP